MTACPSKIELTQYIEGELQGEAFEAVSRHQQECDACAREVLALRSLLARLRTMDSPPLPDTLRPRLHSALRAELTRERRVLRRQPVLFAAAAALVVAIVGFNALLSDTGVLRARNLTQLGGALPSATNGLLSGQGAAPQSQEMAPFAAAGQSEESAEPAQSEAGLYATDPDDAPADSADESHRSADAPRLSATAATDPDDTPRVCALDTAGAPAELTLRYTAADPQELAVQIQTLALTHNAQSISVYPAEPGAYQIWIELPADPVARQTLIEQVGALPGLVEPAPQLQEDTYILSVQVQPQ